MDTLKPLAPFLGSIDAMIVEMQGGKGIYTMPALKNLGHIAIPLVRTIVSPASFRNEQTENTDIDHNGVRRVRAVANKFKYGERQRGLQLLRHFGAGGFFPQNRTEIPKGKGPGAAFDLNTVVFGDSTDADGKVLPVKASVLYSDALSLAPYNDCVDATFHNRASEDGTLFDAENKKNSNNLFERHFVKPGTVMVQTLVLNGKTAPMEALEHLLLCLGIAGAYGGMTSISGINVRTRIAGIFAAPIERDLASPYVLIDRMGTVDPCDEEEAIRAIEQAFEKAYPVCVGSAEAEGVRDALIKNLEADDAGMRARYKSTQKSVATYFDTWFEGIGGKADAKNRAKPAAGDDEVA